MKSSKARLLSALMVCGLTLTLSGTVFADNETDVESTIGDTTLVTPPSSTEHTTSQDTSSSSSQEDSAASTITDGSSTDTPSEEKPASTDMSTETETPTESKPEEPESQQEDPKSDDTSDVPAPVEVPTVDGETTTVIPDTSVPTNNPNVTADTAKQAGASQVGTTSTVTGQIVRDVTTANPVTLSNGATITDIRDGLVTLSTGEKVTPESVNIMPNADGTYTATTIQGDLVTLPHTGEKDNNALMVLGLTTLIMSLFVAFGDRLKAALMKVKSKAR